MGWGLDKFDFVFDDLLADCVGVIYEVDEV